MKTLPLLVLALAVLFTGCEKKKEAEAEKKSLPAVMYVASRNKEVFHHPRCEWALKILPENVQQFSNRAEAITAGKNPCKVCRP